MALASAGVAAAYGVGTPHRHAEEDSVVLSQAAQRRLNHHTRVASGRESRAAVAANATPDQVGQWGPVVDWPVVGDPRRAARRTARCSRMTPSAITPTETYPDPDHTRATVWDPATGSQTPVRVNTGYNIFCSGLAHLMDGTLFVAGGNKDQQLDGIVQTHLFDPATNTWSLGPDMAAGRWYPTVTPLGNGEMLITEGGPGYAGGAQDRRQPARAQHRLAQPAALPVDGRRARRPRLRLGPGPDDARASTRPEAALAELRPARRDQPRLRQPRDVRRRQDPRRRRRALDATTPA